MLGHHHISKSMANIPTKESKRSHLLSPFSRCNLKKADSSSLSRPVRMTDPEAVAPGPPFTLNAYGSMSNCTGFKELGSIRNELEEAEKSLADVLNPQRKSSLEDTVGTSPITDPVDKIQQILVVTELAKMELSTILDNFSTEEKDLVSRAGLLSRKCQEEFAKVDHSVETNQWRKRRISFFKNKSVTIHNLYSISSNYT
jgi:hypothetical protein